jgi:hypothetical protein
MFLRGAGWLRAGGVGLLGISAAADFRHNRDQGHSLVGSAARSGFSNFWPEALTLGMRGAGPITVGLYAMQAIPSLATAAYGWSQARDMYVRKSLRPFSHSFNPSDFALSAQQRGLQSMQNNGGLIRSEAAMLAQRYTR